MGAFEQLRDNLKAYSADHGLHPVYEALSWLWNLELWWWFAPYIVLLGVERVIGRSERASWKDIRENFVFVTVWAMILSLTMEPVEHLGASLASLVGGPFFTPHLGSGGGVLANLGALLVFYLILDFFYYWWHRFQHEHPVLWVTHKLHHVDEKMGVTTAMKAHPTDLIGRYAVVTLPMTVLFKLEPITIFWVAYLGRLFQAFVHLNIDLELGWLNRLISSPNQHRLHHSRLPGDRDRNYAAYFPIYDVIFGTYTHPGKVAPPTGIDTGETYPTVWAAYFRPFTDWWRLVTGRPALFQLRS